LLGAAIVVGSGVFMLYRERRLAMAARRAGQGGKAGKAGI